VLIGPDNGLLAPAVAVAGGAQRAVELTSAEHQLAAPGATFAGRDVFAPAAAHLCNGVELDALGDLIDPAVLTPGMIPLPREEPDGIHAEVLWVDRFGNCQLNVSADELDGGDAPPEVWTVTLGDERRVARSARAYAELGTGVVGLVLDSHGMYSLALDQHSAAAELGPAPGAPVLPAPLAAAAAGRPATPVRLQPRR
jgi:S-adenosylmethionine hydrolase